MAGWGLGVGVVQFDWRGHEWPHNGWICMRRCTEGFDGLNQPVVIKRLIVLSSTQIISCAGSRGARHHVEITQMLSLSSPVDRHAISIWCGGSLTYVRTYAKPMSNDTKTDNGDVNVVPSSLSDQVNSVCAVSQSLKATNVFLTLFLHWGIVTIITGGH